MEEQIIALIGRHTKIGLKDINSESNLISDLGLTSYDVVSIVTEFEDEFDIEIPDKDIKKLEKIKDISKYISEKKKD